MAISNVSAGVLEKGGTAIIDGVRLYGGPLVFSGSEHLSPRFIRPQYDQSLLNGSHDWINHAGFLMTAKVLVSIKITKDLPLLLS